jgi:PAS domain S-box-containing protein
MAESRHVHAIVISDVRGVIQYWSDGAERLFGYSAAEAVGQLLDLIVPPQFRERHWAGFRKAIQTGKGQSDGAATNLPVLCKDGTVRAFPARFMFLTDARNEVVGALGIYSTPAGSEKPFGAIVAL